MNASPSTHEWLAEHCRIHILGEKWLLVENLRIGQQWKDCLTLQGQSTINLHAKTMNTLATGLVACDLAERNLRFINRETTRLLVRQILIDILERQELLYFTDVERIDSYAKLLTRTISDLRLANLEPSALEQSLRKRNFEVQAKGRDLTQLLHEYNKRLLELGLVDYAGCLRIALAGVLDESILLPPDLLVLLPEEFQLSALETQLLNSLTGKVQVARATERVFSRDACCNRLREASAAKRSTFEYFSGLGEVNEVRRALQRILVSSQPAGRLDTSELLYTDYARHVPAILEQLALCLNGLASNREQVVEVDELPVTFAEGIACVYSRPGRALRSWVRWLRSNCMQSKAVQMLREGLLVRPAAAQNVGYARLANTLRGIPIAFQLERYLPQIDAAINNAEARRATYHAQIACGETEADDRGMDWDAGIGTLQVVRGMLSAMIDCLPMPTDSGCLTLQKSRKFLLNCARAESKFDRYARSKLLDDIDGMLESIQRIGVGDLDVIQWLEDLPVESRVMGSGPQPGCIHVAELGSGGYSGRRQLFVVGLDDSRYPRRTSVDPILLDTERRELSASLQTSLARSEREQQTLLRVLHRVVDRGPVHVELSFSTRDLAEDRLQHASPALLELYRVTHHADAQLSDLMSAIGVEASFVVDTNWGQLTGSEAEQAELLGQADENTRRVQIEAGYPHFERSRMAIDALADPIFGAYDGLVPAAGVDLNPTAATQRMSANKFETFGTCPRRYFFKYGLGLSPPDQVEVDYDRWLDGLQFGSLVHNVFEEFLRGHTSLNLIPDRRRDAQPLRGLMQEKIDEKLQEVPVANQDAFERQCEELYELCGIFLQEEERYCLANNARPWILETSIGLNDEPRSELDCQEPVNLTLSDGQVVRLAGRIDRIDRINLHGSEHYAIWDYKSGSAWGFDQTKPFQGGRKLQPFLYLGMLRHRIAATGGEADSVASFGYFFPSAKTEGRRFQWTYGELRSGDSVLRSICELMQRGVFIATDDPQDCSYCHYNTVCHDVVLAAGQAKAKARHPDNRDVLLPWFELRELTK